MKMYCMDSQRTNERTKIKILAFGSITVFLAALHVSVQQQSLFAQHHPWGLTEELWEPDWACFLLTTSLSCPLCSSLLAFNLKQCNVLSPPSYWCHYPVLRCGLCILHLRPSHLGKHMSISTSWSCSKRVHGCTDLCFRNSLCTSLLTCPQSPGEATTYCKFE